MRSIRGKLLLAFGGLALLAVGGMALAGYRILHERAIAHAEIAFRAARDQLGRSLATRYQQLVAVTDLAVDVNALQQGVAGQDSSDFGLGDAPSDEDRLKQNHGYLRSSDFPWDEMAGGGFFAVLDYKGRVIYTSASPNAFGPDARQLPVVGSAFDPAHDFSGAAVVRPDDPLLAKTMLLGDAPVASALVVFSRGALIKNGSPTLAFVQMIPATAWTPKGASAPRPGLLDDVQLGDDATQLALVALDGRAEGKVPASVIAAGLAARGAEGTELTTAGVHWLVQKYPLTGVGAGGAAPIGTIIVAQNLDQGLALLLSGARLLLAIGAALLVLALLAAATLSSRMSRPIVELEAAARRVAGGDLGVTVTPRGTDEIGRLAEQFNRMTDGLRERDRVKTMFKKYLTPDVVDYLLAHPEAQTLGGERRQLTVVFSDLVSFTQLAEARDPAEVVSLLNTYFGKVSEKIAAEGGTVDKYVGDAVMAFFGAPVPRADHAARACLSALAHIEVLDELGPKWARDGWPLLRARIGINTGEMIVGNIGSEQGLDYTVIGDAVNLASRLEGANKEYGTRILVAESVATQAGAAVEAREIDDVILVGRTRPVKIFELVGRPGWLAAHPARAAAVARYAEGRAALRERRFADAVLAFEAAVAADPTDGPSATLLGRARVFASSPPPASWDGVFVATSKG